MTLYKYQAYDHDGHFCSGEIEANDQAEAQRLLSEKGINPTKLSSAEGLAVSLFNARVSVDDIEFFTAEISLLLESGVKIDRGIGIIAKSKSNSALRQLLKELEGDLKQGVALSSSLEKYPQHFDALYINLVKIGEETGTLASVFRRLANDLKFRKDLKRKTQQALTYPSVILFVCVACIVFVFNFIVPQLSTLFESAKELPVYTQILLSTSNFFIQYQIFFPFVLIAVALGFKQALAQPASKLALERLLLKMPVSSKMVLLLERIRFNSSMAMMVSSGVQIDRALLLAAESVKNGQIRSELLTIQKQIRQGAKLTETLSKSSVYPDFFISLLEVAEESGNMAIAFDEIANRSKSEFEGWTTKVTNLLEPMLILAMAGIVGSVVIIMLLSIVSINDFG
ncbi:type II secretion system F family protein [Vibrio rotiferianus]|uniref:type II secretion system F family protein n=1 Tax=Vibrio rotiferianus TaxID=190895 RepID=UPI000B59D989|nr:type II secretion system F family protein [Vibrio rotiferianus]ASI97594.1 secretion system protein [Vibrio rotiferianus]